MRSIAFANTNLAFPSPTIEANGAMTQDMGDFNPTFYDSIADIDLFGMFDPEFDLDNFDAFLEGNLNPGLLAYDQSIHFSQQAG